MSPSAIADGTAAAAVGRDRSLAETTESLLGDEVNTVLDSKELSKERSSVEVERDFMSLTTASPAQWSVHTSIGDATGAADVQSVKLMDTGREHSTTVHHQSSVDVAADVSVSQSALLAGGWADEAHVMSDATGLGQCGGVYVNE